MTPTKDKWLWIWSGWGAAFASSLAGLEYKGLQEGYPLTDYVTVLPRPLRAALSGFLFWTAVHFATTKRKK